MKTFAKLDLKGEVVWQKYAPMQAGMYAAGEDTDRKKIWGRDRFMPTNFAFLPDGDFLLVDGYGSYYVHRYDKDGNWKSSFGGPGEGQGKFNTPHGIWIDNRPGREPAVVVCDRAHHTLQFLSLEGRHLQTLEGFGLPANADTWKQWLLVPELYGRLTILDAQNRVAVRLGDDSERIRADGKFRSAAIRRSGGPASSCTRTTPASTRTATSSSPSGSPPAASAGCSGWRSKPAVGRGCAAPWHPCSGAAIRAG